MGSLVVGASGKGREDERKTEEEVGELMLFQSRLMMLPYVGMKSYFESAWRNKIKRMAVTLGVLLLRVSRSSV